MCRKYEMMLWRQGVYLVSMDGQLVLLYPNLSSITRKVRTTGRTK